MGIPAMVISAVGTGAQFLSAQQQAKAQEKAQAQRNALITEAAIENYKELDKAEQAVLYNAQQDSLESKINALEAQAEAEAFSSATGVRGRSMDMVNQKMSLQAAQNAQAIRMQRDQSLGNINQQAKQIASGAEASYDNSIIQKPSPIDFLAQGVSSAVGAYGQGQALEASWNDAKRT